MSIVRSYQDFMHIINVNQGTLRNLCIDREKRTKYFGAKTSRAEPERAETSRGRTGKGPKPLATPSITSVMIVVENMAARLR